jgi:hypothetical protein
MPRQSEFPYVPLGRLRESIYVRARLALACVNARTTPYLVVDLRTGSYRLSTRRLRAWPGGFLGCELPWNVDAVAALAWAESYRVVWLREALRLGYIDRLAGSTDRATSQRAAMARRELRSRARYLPTLDMAPEGPISVRADVDDLLAERWAGNPEYPDGVEDRIRDWHRIKRDTTDAELDRLKEGLILKWAFDRVVVPSRDLYRVLERLRDEA